MVADGYSLRKAAAANGIGKLTLQGRINGVITQQEAQKLQQKLSKV
jgi:hypothetical protein